MPALQVENLSKHFGQKQALNNLSFEVQEGEVFGLIGPNGAGKTTALRTVATLLQIESGRVSILGRESPHEAARVREIISYLPEGRRRLPPDARARVPGVRGALLHPCWQAGELVARGVAIAALGEAINDKVETYSKGMMRRLLVGRALMASPRLAILDEPSSGLDVINAREVRRIIADAEDAA